MNQLIKLRNTLDLTKGIVCIGDPWYDSASLTLEIKKGNYDCYVKINESTKDFSISLYFFQFKCKDSTVAWVV